MMNGYLVHEESEHLAERIHREAGPNRKDQIDRAFDIVLNRPKTAASAERCQFAPQDWGGLVREAAQGAILLSTHTFRFNCLEFASIK